MKCPKCGYESQTSGNECPKCGVIINKYVASMKKKQDKDIGDLNVRESKIENTSGQGKQAVIPKEVKGWSWGAFLWPGLWGLFNGTYIALLSCLPYVGIIMVIILGIKGNEWAWRNKRWDNVEHFKRVQRKWAIAGLVVYGICLLGIIAAILIPQFVKPEWKEFISSDGGYSVLFPGTPIEQTQQVNTVDGAINMHFIEFNGKTFSYFTGYVDYPESLFYRETADEILDGMRDRGVSKNILLSEDILSLDGDPGRDLKVQMSGGKYIKYQRIYLVEHRAFQIIAVVAVKDEDNKSYYIKKFLDSFKLIGG